MQKNKRRLKKPYRVLRVFYRTVVVLASLVVLLYIVLAIALRPPEIAQAVNEPKKTAESTQSNIDNPSVTETGKKVRKELCYTFLLVASDDGNGNADTIMLMTYDVKSKKIGMVSIPRDTAVRTDRKMPKINAAYNKSIDALKDEVSHLVGIPIDFYVVVDMKAFVSLVDAVGGVTVNIPVYMYYDDPTQHLSIHYTPGEQFLNGKQALEVARFRKNGDGTGYKDSDVGRTKMQQTILAALADKVISWNNVTKVNQFINIFTNNVKTDLSKTNIAYFAKEGVKVDLGHDLTGATLPGDGTKTYKGYKWCYELNKEESLAILNQYVNPYTEPLTLEDVDFLTLK